MFRRIARLINEREFVERLELLLAFHEKQDRDQIFDHAYWIPKIRLNGSILERVTPLGIIEIHLTFGQVTLLRLLAQERGKTVPYVVLQSKLMCKVNALQVQIWRLRKQFKAIGLVGMIQAEFQVGYYLKTEVEQIK